LDSVWGGFWGAFSVRLFGCVYLIKPTGFWGMRTDVSTRVRGIMRQNFANYVQQF